jgi:hypothetical protein
MFSHFGPVGVNNSIPTAERDRARPEINLMWKLKWEMLKFVTSKCSLKLLILKIKVEHYVFIFILLNIQISNVTAIQKGLWNKRSIEVFWRKKYKMLINEVITNIRLNMADVKSNQSQSISPNSEASHVNIVPSSF